MLTGQFLIQIIVVTICVHVLGYACGLLKQQWVIGEIIAGIVLGPSLLGFFFPQASSLLFPANTLPVLRMLGDVGLILYMFSLGAQLDISALKRYSRKALVISLSGIIVPLVVGSVLGYFLYPSLAGVHATPLAFSLLIGTAMSITAFPVLARLLSEMKLQGTRIGLLALMAASVDDVIAWCLLALVSTLIKAQGIMTVLWMLAQLLLFIGVMFFLVRPLFKALMRVISSPQLQFSCSFLLLLCAAYTTNAIGVHPIFGAFVAGIVLPRNILNGVLLSHVQQLNGLLLLPLFFVSSGLNTRIGLIQGQTLWLTCLLVLCLACLCKFLAGFFSTRLTGETRRDALGVGILMNTRGLVELIVLNIGLDLGAVSPTLFAILVIMALVTTMMASPLLSLLGFKAEPARETDAALVTSPLPSGKQP